MNEIWIPVLLVAGIGLIAGLGLAIASMLWLFQRMKKPKLSPKCFPAQTAAPAAIPAVPGMLLLSPKEKLSRVYAPLAEQRPPPKFQSSWDWEVASL